MQWTINFISRNRIGNDQKKHRRTSLFFALVKGDSRVRRSVRTCKAYAQARLEENVTHFDSGRGKVLFLHTKEMKLGLSPFEKGEGKTISFPAI